MSSIFSTLLSTYKSWPVLSAFLASAEGGNLRVEDVSTAESPFALIRYVKGKSDMTNPVVRAFRSVVWDTMDNVPVSVTPFKSVDGECLPNTESMEGFLVERFLDGVMVGAFYDKYADKWRIHTRSCLDAKTRFYSQNRTFAQLFEDAKVDWSKFDKTESLTFVLQHPENRIVVPCKEARATLVQSVTCTTDGTVTFKNVPGLAVLSPGSTWNQVWCRIREFNDQFAHAFQGFVVKDSTGRRWKMRTLEYNRVRKLRGNTARRDYMWLDMWCDGTLKNYLNLFPEERLLSNATIDKWKRATAEVYHIYTDVFKARTLAKTAIPQKYRPLVYGLHKTYFDTLKPAGKTVDWKATVAFMNARDVAQMLFVINWEVRNAGKPAIALEPATAVGTEVLFLRGDDTDDDMPELVPVLDATMVAALTQTQTQPPVVTEELERVD